MPAAALTAAQSAVMPAQSGAARLVPPNIWLGPVSVQSAALQATYAPVSGSASAAMSGIARPLQLAAPTPVCHDGRDSVVEQPPPELWPLFEFQPVSLRPVARAVRVEPCAADGDDVLAVRRDTTGPASSPVSPVEKKNVLPFAAPSWRDRLHRRVDRTDAPPAVRDDRDARGRSRIQNVLHLGEGGAILRTVARLRRVGEPVLEVTTRAPSHGRSRRRARSRPRAQLSVLVPPTESKLTVSAPDVAIVSAGVAFEPFAVTSAER